MAVEFQINTTEFSVLSDGTPDRITSIHWLASKSEGNFTEQSYGSLACDLPVATTTEADILALLNAELGAVLDVRFTERLNVRNAPSVYTGKPWVEMHQVWRADMPLAVDELVLYEGAVWRVLQAHTSQRGWPPSSTPALFTLRGAEDPNAGPQAWVQPTGAHDAYAIGDQVTHDNPNAGGAIWIYESTIDANAQEPGRDGTFDRWWTPISAV